MKILVVDDSSTMRKIVMRTLRQACYDGAEALDKLDQGKADLIFSDVNMPNMNGLDLVKAVRGRDEFAETPLIMVTTEGGEDAIEEAMSSGANGYVVKPFTADKLKDVIDKAVA